MSVHVSRLVNSIAERGDSYKRGSVLPAGSDINFTLGNTSGQRTDLQIVMDFNHQGRYDVVIENVSNCSKDPQDTGTCTNRVNGPPKEFLLFAFFVE